MRTLGLLNVIKWLLIATIVLISKVSGAKEIMAFLVIPFLFETVFTAICIGSSEKFKF
jgi:hypothetical protein